MMYTLIIIRKELNNEYYQVAEMNREYSRTKERANKWESENDRLKTQLDAQKDALTEAEKELEGYKVREEKEEER